MKKFFKSLALIAVAAFGFASCEDVPSPYDRPTVDGGSTEKIVVEPKGSGTVEDPYNVAAAIAYISTLADGEKPEALVYTKGVVANVVKMGNSGSIQFNMKDANADNNLLVYYCDNLGKKPFTAATDLKAGDEVIVCGTVQNFKGNTPEYNSGSYLVSLNGKTEAEGGEQGGGEQGGGEQGGGQSGEFDTNIASVDFGVTNAIAVETKIVNGVTFAFAGGGNNNAPKYYDAGKNIRMYPKNTVTISAQKKIKAIRFNCDTYNNIICVAEGNAQTTAGSVATNGAQIDVTGINSNSVTITNAHPGSGTVSQIRVISFDIDFE